MKSIVFLVFTDFQILDLTGPLSVFNATGFFEREHRYRTRVVSVSGGEIRSNAGLAVVTERAAEVSGNSPIDTIVVVGGFGYRHTVTDEAFLSTVRELSDAARRVASVCTGAFILAAAGLLRGKRATTHWRSAKRLSREYPSVSVDGDRIFIRDGRVWTSAGVTAGIDLALALVEDDAGIDLARAVAQELVVFHRRPGGQSQFSALQTLDPESDRIRCALTFAREHLAEPLPVTRLADEAHLSERQFARAFLAETGETPAKAVERLRAEAARPLVEQGTEPIEAIAARVGFSDPERMRRVFLRYFGRPPQALRREARLEAAAR